MQKLSLFNQDRHVAVLTILSIRAERKARAIGPRGWRKTFYILEARCMSDADVASDIGMFDDAVELTRIAEAAAEARLHK